MKRILPTLALGLLILVLVLTPGQAYVSGFDVNVSFQPYFGSVYFEWCQGTSPCYTFQAAGSSGPPAAASNPPTIPVYVTAPPSSTNINGTAVYFKGWAAQQTGGHCNNASCNLPATSPIVTTNQTFQLTSQTGYWFLLAIYTPQQAPLVCANGASDFPSCTVCPAGMQFSSAGACQIIPVQNQSQTACSDPLGLKCVAGFPESFIIAAVAGMAIAGVLGAGVPLMIQRRRLSA